MEVSRLVVGQSCCFSGARSQYSASSSSMSVPGRLKPGFSLRPGKICGFSDSGHLEYYKSSGVVRCAKKDNIKVREKKKIKNKLKLLKGLSKDLSTFSNVGFGFNSAEVKDSTITEAAELLMEQLEKLRAEEKELKRRKKEEKAKLKAMRMQTCLGNESSSSSSSDSSDSECGEVVDMNRLKRAQATTIPNSSQPVDEQVLPPPPSPRILESLQAVDSSSSIVEEKIEVERCVESCVSCNLVQDYSSVTDSLYREPSNVGAGDGSSPVNVGPVKKIEVCMGGKCKKTGAQALLEEFQKMVGIEVGVTGCKCMGKCRSAPNVRVLNNSEGVQSGGDRSLNNPLFIGVGLEDVDLIVANLLGDNQQNELVVAAS